MVPLGFITVPVAWGACMVAICRDGYTSVADDRSSCLGVIMAMVVVLAAVGLFCWFGAG
jgi:hypothetical protein